MFTKKDIEARLAALEEHNRIHCAACERVERERVMARNSDEEKARRHAEKQAKLDKIRNVPRVRLSAAKEVALWAIDFNGRPCDTYDVPRERRAFEPALIGKDGIAVWTKAYFDARRAADPQLQKALSAGRLVVTDVDPSDVTPASL